MLRIDIPNDHLRAWNVVYTSCQHFLVWLAGWPVIVLFRGCSCLRVDGVVLEWDTWTVDCFFITRMNDIS